MDSISRIEQEVIITMNAAESEAEVYAVDPVYVRKLDKLCERDPEHYKLLKQDAYSKTYIVTNKKLISFRPAREKRELSEEQRAILSERMKSTLARRKDNARINSEQNS